MDDPAWMAIRLARWMVKISNEVATSARPNYKVPNVAVLFLVERLCFEISKTDVIFIRSILQKTGRQTPLAVRKALQILSRKLH